MRVLVAYAGPEGEALDEVALPASATLSDALALAPLVPRLGLDLVGLSFAIHGQRATPATPLREGDRVELLRPLTADPKDARRRRAEENPLPRAQPKPRRPRSLR
jgi:putative ubiquitin-RnfH superfamily antitoxin RatB of RatAB toxin-antitoxin module